MRLGRLKPRLVIIIPNCLRVDRAITFFISHSVVALIPAISMVLTAITNRDLLNRGLLFKNG